MIAGQANYNVKVETIVDSATSRALRWSIGFIIFIAFWFILSAPAAAAPEPGFSVTVDRLIDQTVANNRLPSICLAIGRRGKVIYTHCAGQMNLAGNLPATPSTVYQIGSVTKQFTTTAVMLLANQQPPAVALNAPVANYVPEMATDPTITVASMMNMSAGLVDYTTLPEAAGWLSGVDPLTVVNALAPLPLNFQSGTAFDYSNSDMYVLGVLIENVTGQTYGQYLQEALLKPNGLNATNYGPSPVGPNAVGYTRDSSGNLIPAIIVDPSASYAAGALTSNITDIIKWDWLLLGGHILPPRLVTQMTTPPPINGSSHGEPSVYGYGLISTALYGRPIVMHAGRIPGFNDITSTFTDTGWSIVVMTNIDVTNYVADNTWRAILDTVCAPSSKFKRQCF
jgi:CubicO group peptidase (beta-lactamase class C family)